MMFHTIPVMTSLAIMAAIAHLVAMGLCVPVKVVSLDIHVV